MLTLDARPFIIDLDSTNHTYVNDEEIPKSRYYELQMGDGECSSLTMLGSIV